MTGAGTSSDCPYRDSRSPTRNTNKPDGAGNGLDQPFRIAVDVWGNVYVTGFISENAFRIIPAGIITEIIDSSGDGFGNNLNGPIGIAVDALGEVYVTGFNSNNAFRTFPCKYQIDSGDDNQSIASQSGIAEWAWIQNFEADETCTCITAVETKLFENSSLPKDVTVYIWSDPTPDLDPSDAVLISQSLPTNVDSHELVTIDLVTPVEVASVPEQFWAGAMTFQDDTVFGESDASAPYDTTVPSNHRAWLAIGFPFFNPELLSAAVEPVGDLGLTDGVWVIHPIAEPGPCFPAGTGACCHSSPPCIDGETAFSCVLFDGAYQGDGTQCAALPDHDGDGVLDDCDPDIDDDGVLNAADECDYTPSGINVDATGHPIGDADRDCDVDLVDFGLMQENFTGPLSQ